MPGRALGWMDFSSGKNDDAGGLDDARGGPSGTSSGPTIFPENSQVDPLRSAMPGRAKAAILGQISYLTNAQYDDA